MPRTPDAVLVPPEFADGHGRPALTDAIKILLGGTVYYGKDGHTGLLFGRLDPVLTRLVPHGEANAGAERYEWFTATPPDWVPGAKTLPIHAANDCVLIGFLPTNLPEPLPEIAPDAA